MSRQQNKRTYGAGSATEIAHDVWILKQSFGKDLAGKRLRITRTFHGNKRGADLALIALANHQFVERSNETVADLLNEWLDGKRRAATTDADYRSVVKQWILPELGDTKIDQLTTRRIDRLYANTLRSVSASRVHRLHEVLSGAYRQALKQGRVSVSPVANTSPPVVQRKEPRVPAPKDVVEVLKLAEAQDHRLHLYLHLAVVTGCRRGELAGLRLEDFDLERGSLAIRRSISYTPATGVTVKDTKTGRPRVIAIDRRTCELVGRCADGWLFSSTTLPPRPDRFTHSYSRLAKQLGLDSSLNHLRHFSASQALALGVDIRTVSHRLGHSNANTTLAVYASYVPAADQAAAVLLAGLTMT